MPSLPSFRSLSIPSSSRSFSTSQSFSFPQPSWNSSRLQLHIKPPIKPRRRPQSSKKKNLRTLPFQIEQGIAITKLRNNRAGITNSENFVAQIPSKERGEELMRIAKGEIEEENLALQGTRNRKLEKEELLELNAYIVSRVVAMGKTKEEREKIMSSPKERQEAIKKFLEEARKGPDESGEVKPFEKFLKITQRRSPIGLPPAVRAKLASLRLTRRLQSAYHPPTPFVIGQLLHPNKWLNLIPLVKLQLVDLEEVLLDMQSGRREGIGRRKEGEERGYEVVGRWEGTKAISLVQ